MLVCEACGSENPDGVQFCVMCSSFIWQATPAPPAPPADVTSGASQPDLPAPGSAPGPMTNLPPPQAPLPPEQPAHPPPVEPASPPSWFRRGGSGPNAPAAEATAPDQPALRATVLGDVPAGRRDRVVGNGNDGGSQAATGAVDPALTARPPERARPPRVADAPTGRPQQALALMLDQSLIEVEPGATASFRVTVRNTGVLVEGCRVGVRGIPQAWQRMEPDLFNLDVDGQRDVQVHISPPRSPKTVEGRTALAIVVRSEFNEEIQQRCDATLVIKPYFDLTTSLEPTEIEGKRSGRTYVNVENKGNKAEHLSFTGTEPGKRLRFTFRPSELEVRPGQRASVGVDVKARRRVWGGVEKSRQFSVSMERPEGPPAPPMQGRFTQFASWPKWVLPVVFAALAIAIPTTLIAVTRSLDKKEANALIAVPDLNNVTADAAKQSLSQKGLVANVENVFRDGAVTGHVVDQKPAAGEKVAKGTNVKVSVAADRNVPDVQNKPFDVAKQALASAGLTMELGDPRPGTTDNADLVAWQLPLPGQPSTDGKVKVGVYSAPQDIKILNYKDLDQVSVETGLTNVGLVVKIQNDNSDKPRGTILGQAPNPGATLKKGQTITLVVSTGIPPTPSTTAFATAPPST